jgi:hypothetical protein
MFLSFLGNLTSFLYVQLLEFLTNHNDRPDQKTPLWYTMKSETIGGSEIKAFLSKNWERTTLRIMSKKLGLDSINFDITPCHWGNFFEPCTECIVEQTLGCRIIGENSNISAPLSSGISQEHANSPDGLGVVSYYLYDGEWKILTTDIESQSEAFYCQIKHHKVDFEFKSPISRVPTDKIPKMYLPQLWSGLVCIPIAEFALFVDVVYRKCTFDDLGNTPIYDLDYHKSDLREDRHPEWTYPIAWGLSAIYAPKRNTPNNELITGSTFDNQKIVPVAAPKAIDFNDVLSGSYVADIDPKTIAYSLSYENECFPNQFEDTFNPMKVHNISPIDFGDCNRFTFEKMLSMNDKKYFIHRHTDPCYPDGRGFTKLLTEEGRGDTIEQFKKDAPVGYYLLGYVPWKVMDVRYIAEDRNPEFLDTVAPRISSFVKELKRIKSTKNPRQEFYNYSASITGKTSDDVVKNIMETIYA